MKVVLIKDLFVKAVGTAVSVVNAKSSLPILSNILIETEGKDELRITGTDLEIGITTRTSAQIIEEGSVTVPAKKVFDILREMPSGEIELQVSKNNSVYIKNSDSKTGSQFTRLPYRQSIQ